MLPIQIKVIDIALTFWAVKPKFLSWTGYRVLLWWRRARRNCAEWSFPFKQLQRGRTSPQECNMRCSALHPLSIGVRHSHKYATRTGRSSHSKSRGEAFLWKQFFRNRQACLVILDSFRKKARLRFPLFLWR